ncbi:hypothetical protein H4582DRAFT_2077856 [Lactarius indigo]|nr:hypothetical protein H4582DRAFT_2077856 [Lactarius indigo]
MLTEGIASAFPPSKLVFAGVGVLLLVSHFASSLAQDIFIDIFGRIENFFGAARHLYLGPTNSEDDMEFAVEILGILAVATKEMEQSRAKNFLKVAWWTDLEDGLKKLDKTDERRSCDGGYADLSVCGTIS